MGVNMDKEYLDKKYKFLAKIHQSNDFYKGLRESCDENFSKLISKVIIGDNTAYSWLTKLGANIDTPISEDEYDDFYKYVYDNWYDLISALNVSGEMSKYITRLISDPKMKKENMSPKACQMFFHSVDNYEKLKSFGLLPIFNQKGVEYTMDGYEHVRPFTKHFAPQIIDCRLYLNVTSKNALALGKELTNKCLKDGVDLYFKFWASAYKQNARNDSFLIYTNYNDVEKFVSMLREIRKEKPEIFKDVKVTNPLLANIDGFIGFGEEPAYKHSSFNAERSTAIEEYLSNAKKHIYKKMGNYTGAIGDIDTCAIQDQRIRSLTLKEYIKYEIVDSFKSFSEKEANKIMTGKSALSKADSKQMVEFFNAMHSKTMPAYFSDQIEKISDKAIEKLQCGVNPYSSNRVLMFDGKIKWIDTNISEKLVKAFQLEDIIVKHMTKEKLKPYFEKQHVGIDTPFLNLETEKEFESNKDKKNIKVKQK